MQKRSYVDVITGKSQLERAKHSIIIVGMAFHFRRRNRHPGVLLGGTSLHHFAHSGSDRANRALFVSSPKRIFDCDCRLNFQVVYELICVAALRTLPCKIFSEEKTAIALFQIVMNISICLIDPCDPVRM